MLAFVLRRAVLSVPVFLAATAIVFGLVSFRGDPLADLRNNSAVSPESLAQLEAEYHLDDPFPSRYVRWVGDFVRGDWGTSYGYRRPVSELIQQALPNSLMLLVGSAVVSVTLAVVIGVVGAVRHRSPLDHGITALSYFGLAMPVFWFGLLLQLVLVILPLEAWNVRLFYVAGKHATGKEGQVVDLVQHIALPVFTLSLAHIAAWSRFQRSSMLDALVADYVRTARAKGVTERAVVFRHALRNALIPFVTVSALGVAAMVGGAVVTERIFSWPGMGTLFVNAVQGDDYPVILSWLAVVSGGVLLANLLVDIAYRFLAPRTAPG